MHKLSALFLFAVICISLPSVAQENHLKEAGIGVVFLRSAFAHGYRHGYEEGYHRGNVDINMARTARTQFEKLKLNSGYSLQFGLKQSFDKGFELGLAAGYKDGYAGRTFRAIDSLRAVAITMPAILPPEDPNGFYFDQGIAAGYGDGFRQGKTSLSPTTPLDFHTVGCVHSRSEQQQEPASQDNSYCEGYRRGFALGRADALVLRLDYDFLEASK